MKGKTTCPNCKHEFEVDVPDDKDKYEAVCPKCDKKFSIQPKCSDSKSNDECSWEEHGEPRKTVLSKIKPKTKKPIIAAILLVCVFSLGITTAVFSEAFIISTTDMASGVGLKGSVEIWVTDQSNNSIEGINIVLDNYSGKTDENGFFTEKNVELGIHTLQLYGEGYKTQSREMVVAPFFNTESTVKMEEGDGPLDTIEFDSRGCTLILAIFSVFALLGTITCLKRHHIDVAYAGSLIGILSFGFFFIGSILSIIAFVLIMKSKEEFENGKKGKIF